MQLSEKRNDAPNEASDTKQHTFSEAGKYGGDDYDIGYAVDAVDVEHGEINEKRILRKMDIRLIPMLSLLYFLSFLDRGNIGNARIEGLEEDLDLKPKEYSWCCKLFSISFS